MDHLVGCKLPDVSLQSTDGENVNPAKLSGRAVIFCYPYTGRPNIPDPPGWDDIPGAHGSTPQALAFSESYEAYRTQNMRVFGLSFQNHDWQVEFVSRTRLRVQLLSDHQRIFADALDLPRFKAGQDDYLTRLTIMSKDGIVTGVRYPVPAPAEDATAVLNLISNLDAT
jgi:peroxiredoxin